MPHSALVTSLFYVNLGYIIARKEVDILSQEEPIAS